LVFISGRITVLTFVSSSTSCSSADSAPVNAAPVNITVVVVVLVVVVVVVVVVLVVVVVAAAAGYGIWEGPNTFWCIFSFLTNLLRQFYDCKRNNENYGFYGILNAVFTIHVIFPKTFPANQQNRFIISHYQCHGVKNL